jgi:hypothetical protein
MQRIIEEYGVPKVTVEIGCFEGETTFNLAHLLKQRYPLYKHYAIDPFNESDDLPLEKVQEVKQRFLDNLKEVTDDTVEFLHMKSFDGLVDLYKRGVKADLVYVDGDHRAPEVLQDAILGFELLNKGGIMLFDDCVSWRFHKDITHSPKIAVDNFIQCYWNRLEVIEMPTGYQTAIRKKV